MADEPILMSPTKPVDKEILDLNTAQVLKNPRHLTDQLVTKEQLASLPARPPPAQPTIPLPPNISAPIQPISPPGAAAQGTPSAAVPVPVEAPPILPTDSPRVQDRINKLYGKMKTAEERALELAQENADLRIQVMRGSQPQSFASPVAPPSAPLNGFSYPSSPPQASLDSGSMSAGQPEPPITRGELFAALNRMTQVLSAQTALANAHNVSRAEAERDFPDVFQDSRLKQAADEIWARDPALKQDPMGPYKAVALARGLYGTTRAEAPAPVGPPPTVRKEALSAVGVTVPEGPGTPNDRATRYAEAIARYQTSGNEQDLVIARLIQNGAM